MKFKKTERILGEFPIFAEEGKVQTVGFYTYNNHTPYGFYTIDKLGYEKGTKDPLINGAINFVTKGLNYLYRQGVPEFTLGVAYPKGAIVVFKGALYVSFVNDNIKHVSQSIYWGKFAIESNDSKYNDYSTSCNPDKKDDGLPIGTILTVPVTIFREGYIDYVEGQQFNPMLYPELYKVLGKDSFNTTTNISDSELLPVGTIVHTLNNQTIPNGWIEWKNQYGNLAMYPELLNLLSVMVQAMPLDSVSRNVWSQALQNQTLPDLNGSFMRPSNYPTVLGELVKDTALVSNMVVPPVIVDKANTLNTYGLSRETDLSSLYSPISGSVNVQESSIKSQYVLVAHKAELYNSEAKDININIDSNAIETAPKHLNTRVIIKAKSNASSNIPLTHKQIIKAF